MTNLQAILAETATAKITEAQKAAAREAFEAKRLADAQRAEEGKRAAAEEAAKERRAALRRALKVHAEAQRDADAAAAALALARQMAEDARAEVGKFKSLGMEIARHHAEQIAAAALAGAGAPKLKLSTELARRKGELEAAQAELDRASAELASVEQATGVLVDGVSDAERKLHGAGIAVQESARPILAAAAEAVLAEVLEHQRALWKEIDFIVGFTKQSLINGGTLPTEEFLRLQKFFDRREDAKAQDPSLIETYKWQQYLDTKANEQAKVWSDYFGRLCQDADAKLD